MTMTSCRHGWSTLLTVAAVLFLSACAAIGMVVIRRTETGKPQPETPVPTSSLSRIDTAVLTQAPPEPAEYRPLCPDDQTFTRIDDALKKPKTVCALSFTDQTSVVPEHPDVPEQPHLPYWAPTKVPASIAALTDLKVFTATNRGLTDLPLEMGKLADLTELSLFNNSFAVIPDIVFTLRKLTLLDMSRNRLTAVPAGIGNLTGLTTLNLYGNRIVELPPEIGNLTQLTMLQLSENRLKKLPDSITKLTHLTDVYLQTNPIGEAERARIRSLLPHANIRF
jgi:hypothetical protein